MDQKFHARFRRRLCYGNPADFESPSLPLTEAAVDYLHDCMPVAEGLGRLDLSTASKITGQKSVSPSSTVVSALYAKRLRQRNTEYLQCMSSSDIFFISMMMASKYLYDEGVEEEVFNDEWADETGQEVEDVNQMEIDFLNAMDWGLFVKAEEFEDVLTALERRLALKEGLSRGWFTYTELTVLLDSGLLYNLWNQVAVDCSKMATLLSTVYLAGVASMMGSAAIAVELSGPLTTATLAVLTVQPSSLFNAIASSPASLASLPLSLMEAPPLSVGINDGNETFFPFEGIPMEMQALESASVQGEENSGNDSFVFGQATASSMIASEATVVVGAASNVERGGTAEREDNKVGKPAGRASVLSLWLFDSLLSHIWSVFDPLSRQRREGCKDKSQDLSSPSASENPRCCDDAMDSGYRKSCRFCSQRHVPSAQSGQKHLKGKSARDSRKNALGPELSSQSLASGNACRSEMDKHCSEGVDFGGNDPRRDDSLRKLPSTSPLRISRCNVITSKVSDEPHARKPNDSVDPSLHLDAPTACFLQKDCDPVTSSSRERQKTSLISTVLRDHCRSAAFSSISGIGDISTVFSRLPGPVLVT